MRLGQLSRKMGIPPSEIVAFLAAKNIAIYEDSNTRLEDDHVALVTQQFAPELIAEVDTALAEEKQEASTNSTPSEEVTRTAIQESVETEAQLPDLIRAPKIELTGLKVLGKIEIPEKKKKETTSAKEQTESASDSSLSSGQSRKHSKHHTPRSYKNPVALQREREEKEAERRRQEKLKLEKEQRTQRYQRKVKVQAPTKKTNYLKEHFKIGDAHPSPTDKPKTLWGKFLRCLRT